MNFRYSFFFISQFISLNMTGTSQILRVPTSSRTKAPGHMGATLASMWTCQTLELPYLVRHFGAVNPTVGWLFDEIFAPLFWNH